MANNTSGQGFRKGEVPEEIKGLNWGAFLLNWIWAIGNQTWIGLLCLIPCVNVVVQIVLLFKGNEWAWQSKEWDSVEHFLAVQKKWTYWGIGILIAGFALGFLSIVTAIAIPAIVNARG